jgi:hypothetical protein
VIWQTSVPVPALCYDCGKPFPWTAERLKVGKELADELEDRSLDDREKIKGALEDIARDGPRTEAAAVRLKRLLGKGTTATGKALWNIAISVATEAATKGLFGLSQRR